jgi:hypothetical protein
MRHVYALFFLLIIFIFSQNFDLYAKTTVSDKIDYNEFLDDSGWYGSMVRFFHIESSAQDLRTPLDVKSLAVCIAFDLLVSLIALWIALYFSAGIVEFNFKHYFDFFVALNICWYLLLLWNYFCWGVLNLLVLRLRPELRGVLVDFFSVAVIVESSMLFAWLLARNFELTFFSAIGAFFISQAIYFVILFIFSVAAPKSYFYCNIINANLGFLPSVREYLYDVFKLSSHYPVLLLLRLRLLHM